MKKARFFSLAAALLLLSTLVLAGCGSLLEDQTVTPLNGNVTFKFDPGLFTAKMTVTYKGDSFGLDGLNNSTKTFTDQGTAPIPYTAKSTKKLYIDPNNDGSNGTVRFVDKEGY